MQFYTGNELPKQKLENWCMILPRLICLINGICPISLEYISKPFYIYDIKWSVDCFIKQWNTKRSLYHTMIYHHVIEGSFAVWSNNQMTIWFHRLVDLYLYTSMTTVVNSRIYMNRQEIYNKLLPIIVLENEICMLVS